jgi:hypothetical protein
LDGEEICIARKATRLQGGFFGIVVFKARIRLLRIFTGTERFVRIQFVLGHPGTEGIRTGRDESVKKQTKTDKTAGNGNGKSNGHSPTFHFAAVESSDVPRGRKGKHRTMVARILEDLGNRSADQAVRVPLSGLEGEKIQNLRSALNRVSRLKKLPIATASDEKYLYVWNAKTGPGPEENQA